MKKEEIKERYYEILAEEYAKDKGIGGAMLVDRDLSAAIRFAEEYAQITNKESEDNIGVIGSNKEGVILKSGEEKELIDLAVSIKDVNILIGKYHSIEQELEKRKELEKDFVSKEVFQIQVDTNKKFIEDLFLLVSRSEKEQPKQSVEELFTGKAKEKFEEWWLSQVGLPIKDFEWGYKCGFYDLDLSMQWGVYLDFAESEKIDLEIYKAYEFDSLPYHYIINSQTNDFSYYTRKEAQIEAIKKVNELIK